MKNVSVISPIYNNASGLISRLDTVYAVMRKHFNTFELVLIDDASTDKSFQLVKTWCAHKKDVKLTQHTKNLGIAKTYQELYRKAFYDSIVLFSLGAEWDAKDIPRLIAALSTADVVIGKRKNKQYSVSRQLVSSTYNLLTQILFGVATYDAGSIKAMRKKVAQIPLLSTSVFDEAERIIRAYKAHYRVQWIEVSHKRTHETRNKKPQPSLILPALVDMVRVWFSFLPIGGWYFLKQ